MCVQAPVAENVWTTLGPESSKDAGKTVVNVRAKCGLNQQEWLLEVIFSETWNQWGMSHAIMTQICC